MTLRANVTAFFSGMTACGKSSLMHDWMTSKFPRVISFDPTGDTWDRAPDAVPVRDLEELRRYLRRCVVEGFTDWHFVLAPHQAPAVFAALVPTDSNPSPDSSPSLSRQLGGVLVECGECYAIMPNTGTRPEILVAATAGRHALLSLGMAAQRPALTNRTLTANCQHTFAFLHGDRNDFAFFAETISADVAEEIRTLDRYEFVHYQRGALTATRYDKRRRPVKIIPLLKGIGSQVPAMTPLATASAPTGRKS